jgi:hypothetical protein
MPVHRKFAVSASAHKALAAVCEVNAWSNSKAAGDSINLDSLKAIEEVGLLREPRTPKARGETGRRRLAEPCVSLHFDNIPDTVFTAFCKAAKRMHTTKARLARECLRLWIEERLA